MAGSGGHTSEQKKGGPEGGQEKREQGGVQATHGLNEQGQAQARLGLDSQGQTGEAVVREREEEWFGGATLDDKLREVDVLVARLWAALPPNTLLVLTSAHGDLGEADRVRVSGRPET